MRRITGLLRLQVCAVVGAAVFISLLGGCPIDLPGLWGGGLTVTASTSDEGTVDKTINLVADISGGTTPYTVAWTQTAGPTMPITDLDQATASFRPTSIGTYRFRVNVTDASTFARSGSAQVEIIVGDIQFTATGMASSSGAELRVTGNPATAVVSGDRDEIVEIWSRVNVSDPIYNDDDTTEMTVAYEIVGVPSGAVTSDISLDRMFDTFSNAPLGNDITIRANPDNSFTTLTNIATTFTNYGSIVPGDYIFRASVTNPAGVVRTRDLVITMRVEDLTTNLQFPGDTAGPGTLAVRELPAGGPGRVTDTVMTADQTTTMTVTVFPSSDTNYRFFLVDNVGIPYPDYVSASATDITADGNPHDIVLTIGDPDMVPATYALYFESYTALGQIAEGQVTVNGGEDIRFHVTEDYLDETLINSALVGETSNNPYAPTIFQGFSGGDHNDYGQRTVFADVNIDGAQDTITLLRTTGAVELRMNVDGYMAGSTEMLRHPENDANFNGLSNPDFSVEVSSGANVTGRELAAGDVNGDSLDDIAVSVVDDQGDGLGDNDVGWVVVFFHTGDPAQPYSRHPDQMLFINGPAYAARQFRNNAGDLTSAPAVGVDPGDPSLRWFGVQIAIADVFGGDDEPDLIITDPGFGSMQIYGAGGPRPAALDNQFYDAMEGRVYVFSGGSTGNLLPNRPDIVASEILETGVTDATPEAATVDVAETNAMYDAVYTGNTFDQIGYSLAATAEGFAVGSPEAFADALPTAWFGFGPFVDGARVADETMVTTTVGGVTRNYGMDVAGDAAIAGADVIVDISGANEDLRSAALAALRDGINADADRVVDAEIHPLDPEVLVLTSVFSAVDNVVRASGYAQPNDGIVYRLAADTASGTALANPIIGTQNSNMGLGATLAKGDVDGSGADDLLIGALDSGDDEGVNGGGPFMANGADDGAVFFVWNDTTTLVPITGVGANTGLAPGGTTVAPTALGAHVGIADANGDGLAEAFFTEVGFDRIFMIMGAATPATTPDLTFTGVVFQDDLMSPPVGETVGDAGCFVFGDINGDGQFDWLFIDDDINFGFAGFER